MKKLLLAVLFSLPLCATVTFTMDNAAILYSPYNWSSDATSARTINSGAYFRTIVSGTSISITTDTSANTSPFSQMWIRYDTTPWVKFTLSAGNPTFAVATGLASRKHLLEFVVKSTSYSTTRWASSQTMVTITGIVADAAATLTAPVRRTKNVLIYGDSITEGALVNSDGAALNAEDITGCYSWELGKAIDAEIGIVGFVSQGILAAGAGGVPALPSSYNLIYSGVSRVFTPTPDLIIYNEGQNDTATITTAYTALMNAVLGILPTTRQLALSPFSQGRASEVSAAVTAVGNSLVTYRSTSGWWSTADSSDNVHPYDYAHLLLIAPRLIPVVQAILNSSYSRCIFPTI